MPHAIDPQYIVEVRGMEKVRIHGATPVSLEHRHPQFPSKAFSSC